jgi:hypothetical protein
MLKPEAQEPWGNHFGFLPIWVPIMGVLENPLDLVRKKKMNMDIDIRCLSGSSSRSHY